MSKKAIFFIIIIILVLIFSFNSYGCWVSLTFEEMINESESVVIGTVLANTPKQIKIDNKANFLLWYVNIDYVLKGNNKNIKIVTDNKDFSTYFELTAIILNILKWL